MASVYNQTDPDQDAYANNVATNVFNSATSRPMDGGQQIQSGNQGGDLSQSVGANASGTPKPQGSGQQTANSSKEVIRRNAGKMQSPVDLGEMSTNIKKSKDDLQAEANSYVDTQSKNNYGVANEAISGALQGDEAAYQNTAQRLQQARPQYENFTQKTNTDYASKVNDLSDSSLRQYFKNQAGAMGTAGEAAFDSMLLGQNKQFKQDRDKVKNEAIGLNSDVQNIKKETDEKAKGAYETAYDTETGRIKNQIASSVDPLRQKADQAAAQENARRQQLASMGLSDLYNTADYRTWISQLANNIGQNDSEDAYLNEMVMQGLGLAPGAGPSMGIAGSVSPKSEYNFIDINRTPVNANNFLDAATADQLNRGYQLLGAQSPGYYAAGGPGNAYNFNTQRASDFLNTLVGDKRKADEAEAQRVAQANAQEKARQDMVSQTGATMAQVRAFERDNGRLPTPDEINSRNPFAPGAAYGPGKNTAVGQAVQYGQDVGQKANKEGGKIVEGIKSNFTGVGGGCFMAGTYFKMADGTTKAVQEIDPGDVMEMGDVVKALAIFRSDEIYDLNDVLVSGCHAVLQEGKWQRVRDVAHAKRMPHLDGNRVYVVWNDKHRMVSADGTIWADYAETDHSAKEIEENRNLELLNMELQ